MTPEQKAVNDKEQKKRRTDYINDVRNVLATPSGRRVIRKILEDTQLFRQTFAGEQTHMTAFASGARNVGLTLFNDLSEASPDTLLKILKGDIT